MEGGGVAANYNQRQNILTKTSFLNMNVNLTIG